MSMWMRMGNLVISEGGQPVFADPSTMGMATEQVTGDLRRTREMIVLSLPRFRVYVVNSLVPFALLLPPA